MSRGVARLGDSRARGAQPRLGLDQAHSRYHHLCPDVREFAGELGPILGRAVTEHWFDPCELLAADARSELRPEHRRRQDGGGWEQAEAAVTSRR